MFKFLALFALLDAVAFAGSVPRRNSHGFSLLRRPAGKIINGTETTIEANPYQISIQLKDYGHWCGGSIISKKWVLTAAHCIQYAMARYIVLAGTANQFEGGSLHHISEIITHEKFGLNQWSNPINDIALIQLADTLKLDKTKKPIGLYANNEESLVGSISVITGWGETGKGYPDILNLVEIPIISKEKCSEMYADVGGLPEGQICAAYENGGKDACQGDSGGPLTINGRQAGIVSWGEDCAKPGNPGVYTEIAHHRDWIKNHSGV